MAQQDHYGLKPRVVSSTQYHKATQRLSIHSYTEQMVKDETCKDIP